jgi:hypothetical protein
MTISYICYIFSGFGILYQEKSGNPGIYVGRKLIADYNVCLVSLSRKYVCSVGTTDRQSRLIGMYVCM